MGLIGQEILREETRHPQEFVDALYEDVYEQLGQDVDSLEADVIVMIERLGDSEDEPGGRVIDYQVTRIGDDYLPGFVPDDPSHPNADVHYLKKVDEWARGYRDEHEAGHRIGYLFMHKHVEGDARAYANDREANNVLVAADMARGTHVPRPETMQIEFRRLFKMMAVINRDESYPLDMLEMPHPTYDEELDLLIFTKMSGAIRESLVYHLGDERIGEFDANRAANLELIEETHRRFAEHPEANITDPLFDDLRARGIPLAEQFGRINERLHDEVYAKTGIERPRPPVEFAELDEMIDRIVNEIRKHNPTLGDALDGGRKDRPANDEDFPILGRPAYNTPSQPLAAEPIEPSPDGRRPDVPEVFDDLDIRWD